AASSAIGEVRLAGYTQRVSSATGRTEDEYVLAIRIPRSEWRAIDFSRIEAIDPVAALARFDPQCSRDRSGHMRAIIPALRP
ncbi:MAG TPA: hypothetical protein VFR28_07295, partial [Allosphingosinicella sp.]|nr:hypothetical protein [Allosphingosinicella sp.]